MSDDTNQVINEQLVLISGESGTGKSASLRNIRNQERWMFLNSEAGKRLPFKNKFDAYKIIDPYQVHEGLDFLKVSPDHDGGILDTLTFLMDMMETQYVLRAVNTQNAWGSFAQFFKEMMQEKVASLDKPFLILAHTRSDLDEKNMEMKTAVPIKGALRNNGIEAYFSTVVSTKKVPLTELKEYENDMLHITEEDEMLGYKHVFQTRLTKKTVGERIRSPMGMFTKEQTFIDNDAQLLLDHMKDYYA
ncbi:Sak4-like ssDNA annealing protein [Sinorhizobium phage ort11]|uniref:ATP-binding protein n=1 Tax=Sinorhizobium phage ort11 TaxID=2599764 RepID=A0A5C2H235_9CAUD|nr:Sak4-like ssDNA annealing protein [Sinorhizobium phage ort11]QEP29860.1 hypothetical protein Smphiort11_062 [Sinorhizobium phage ort11]